MVEMTGMVVAVYAVQILLRMRAEEADGPLEPILATAVSRTRWVISHVLNAGLGALVLLLVFTVSMGLAAGVVLGDVPGQLRALVEAGLVQWPGIMVIGGLVIAVTALLPRWAGALSWTVVMVAILLGPLFGAATFQLPLWAQDISPFTHIPKAPAADITAVPVAILVAIAGAFVVTGLVAFRRRNLTLPV
jgi:ABC-2 type transport system permease protein